MSEMHGLQLWVGLPTALEETIHRFVTESDYKDPTDRVRIAEELYTRCAAQDERDEEEFEWEMPRPVSPY